MIPDTVIRNPWVQFVTYLVGTALMLWLVVQVWDIIFLFLLAFFLAYILDPAVDLIEKGIGINRLTSILILLFFVALFLTGLGYYLTQQALLVTQEIGSLVENPPDIQAWAESNLPETFYISMKNNLENLESGKFYQGLLDYLRTHLENVTETLTKGSSVLVGFARQTLGAVGIIVNLVVFVFASIYFLRDFDAIIFEIRKQIPLRFRPSADEIFKEIDELLRAFFRGHLIVCVTIGILYGGGYLLVGLKGGFLIGFLSGLMNFIPYVGPSIGFLLAIGLGMYQFGFTGPLFGIVLVFVLVQSLEGNILTPNIVGGAVGLNPVTVIFALLVFGKFFGFIGLLLAIPFAGIFKVILQRLVRYYRSTEFFRKPPNS